MALGPDSESSPLRLTRTESAVIKRDRFTVMESGEKGYIGNHMAELGRKYQTNVSKHKSCSLFMNRPGQPGRAPRFAYGMAIEIPPSIAGTKESKA